MKRLVWKMPSEDKTKGEMNGEEKTGVEKTGGKDQGEMTAREKTGGKVPVTL